MSCRSGPPCCGTRPRHRGSWLRPARGPTAGCTWQPAVAPPRVRGTGTAKIGEDVDCLHLSCNGWHWNFDVQELLWASSFSARTYSSCCCTETLPEPRQSDEWREIGGNGCIILAAKCPIFR